MKTLDQYSTKLLIYRNNQKFIKSFIKRKRIPANIKMEMIGFLTNNDMLEMIKTRKFRVEHKEEIILYYCHDYRIIDALLKYHKLHSSALEKIVENCNEKFTRKILKRKNINASIKTNIIDRYDGDIYWELLKKHKLNALQKYKIFFHGTNEQRKYMTEVLGYKR